MTKLTEATLTAQGQVTVPRKVRERLGLRKGAKVAFLEDEKGHIYIEEAEPVFVLTREEWKTFLNKCEREPVKRFHGKRAALAHLKTLMKPAPDRSR